MNVTDITPQPVSVALRSPRPRPNKITPPASGSAPASPKAPQPGASGTISDRTKTIVATINVGWGNSVYIRGEGGSLNWDMGVPMMCSGDDRWVWCCREEEAPRQFKFLRNDQDWALGDNQITSEADLTVCHPAFPG